MNLALPLNLRSGNMAPDLLKPLAVFCSQSQSQRYIKTIKNLGDAWRTLTDEPTTESDQKHTVVELSFDLILKITNGLEHNYKSEPTVVEMSTHEPPSSLVPSSTEPPAPGVPVRHYRIFADYGTDFIWRNPDDINHDEDSHVESEDVLSPFPPSVMELYDSWVDTYTDNFKKRCEDTQDYSASVFLTASEEVAWNVAGYLLAWRITLGPQIGSVEYSTGDSKYLLELGKETSVTLEFLQDQIEFLVKGEPSE